MCDTEDKLALLTAVKAALGAYEGGAYGPPLAGAMRRLRQAYDPIAQAELPPERPKLTPPPKKGQARIAFPDDRDAGPLFARKQNPSPPTSGYRVAVVDANGKQLHMGKVDPSKRRAWDGWLVRQALVKEPYAKATLYRVTKNKGTVVLVEQLDPYGIWVQVKGGGS